MLYHGKIWNCMNNYGNNMERHTTIQLKVLKSIEHRNDWGTLLYRFHDPKTVQPQKPKARQNPCERYVSSGHSNVWPSPRFSNLKNPGFQFLARKGQSKIF